MSKLRAYITVAIMLSICVKAEELQVNYSSGWSPPYSIKIDLSSGEMLYKNKEMKEPKKQQLMNHTETAKFIRHLLSQIDKMNPGGDKGDVDGTRYNIVVRKDGIRQVDYTIGTMSYFPAVHMNENYDAQRDIDKMTEFRRSLPSYLLTHLINDIVEIYFIKEWKHVTGNNE